MAERSERIVIERQKIGSDSGLGLLFAGSQHALKGAAEEGSGTGQIDTSCSPDALAIRQLRHPFLERVPGYPPDVPNMAANGRLYYV